jgi:Protein of unknown function (DUF4235)
VADNGDKSDQADRSDPAGSKMLAVVAAFGAAWAARRVIRWGWTQVTGKEPPGDPHDPHVGIGEALAWVVVLGAAREGARLLATRATTRGMREVEAATDTQQ